MRKQLATAAVLGLLATAAACSSDTADTESAATAGATTTQSHAATSAPSDAATNSGAASATPQDADLATHTFEVSPQEAIDIGHSEVGDGIVHAIEIEWDSKLSAWIWDVKILAGNTDSKVKINADTGEVVSSESESTSDTEEAIDLDEPMTFDEAKSKALQERDGRIESWKLEFDDGQIEYQFDVVVDGQSDEVTVNAATGQTSVD